MSFWVIISWDILATSKSPKFFPRCMVSTLALVLEPPSQNPGYACVLSMGKRIQETASLIAMLKMSDSSFWGIVSWLVMWLFNKSCDSRESSCSFHGSSKPRNQDWTAIGTFYQQHTHQRTSRFITLSWLYSILPVVVWLETNDSSGERVDTATVMGLYWPPTCREPEPSCVHR